LLRALLFLALTACQAVFPRNADEDIVDATMPVELCEPALVGTDDEDRDGQINADDPCPRVANESPHDEDGDGVPDACDRCPIFGDLDQRDDDCDGLSNACDPDPTTPHQIEFLSFESDAGVRLDTFASIVGDSLRIAVPTSGPETFGQAHVRGAHPKTGRYELDFTIDAWSLGADLDVGLRLDTIPDRTDGRFAVIVRSGSSTNEFAIHTFDPEPSNNVDLVKVPLPDFSGTVSFHLTVDIDGDLIRARLAGAAQETIEATAEKLGPMIEHGFQMHDNDNGGVLADAAYMARITLAN
jgi:hypothetical protein